jgi:hypothetical protein
MTEYPNREHEKADKAAIIAEAQAIRAYLGNEQPEADGDATQRITGRVHDLTANLAILGALREVREAEAADRHIAQRQGMSVHLMRWATEAGLDTDLNLPPAERAADLARRLAAGERR